MSPSRARAARRGRAGGLAGVLATAAALGLGCVGLIAHLPPAFSPCRALAPVAPAALGADFVSRLQVSLRAGGRERAALDAVFQKRGDRLVVVAFDRGGARLFSAVQEGSSLRVEPAPGRRRPIAVDALLGDLALLRGVVPAPEGLALLHDRTPSGARRSVVRDVACDRAAVYVVVEERASP